MRKKAAEFLNKKSSMKRFDWINENFAQLNLLINSVVWVNEVEEVFRQLQQGQLSNM